MSQNLTTTTAIEKRPRSAHTRSSMRRSAVVAIALSLATLARADSKSDADAAAGDALRRSGRYADARKLLEATVLRDGRSHAARLALGRVYRATGEERLARAIWNTFYDDYERGGLDKKSARDLTYVALAARYLGSWEDANDTFRDAVAVDAKGPAGARANVEWAALFLEKYDAGHAEQCLQEALKVLPDDADAHALYARVKLEQGNDIAGAEHELAAALKKDPHHPGALALKAELLVDDEAYADAIRAAAEIRKRNPEDERARIVAATAKLLSDDKAGFAEERDRALAVNPHDSQFFHEVAEFLVKARRYNDANALELEAIKIDPKNFVAQAALGSNLLRLGDDAGGLVALRRAWDGDPYNVRTYNLLNLFEQVIPKDYEIVDGKPFRLRVPSREKPLLLRYARPMLTREYAELIKRYGFQPEGPLTIELFADAQHYAVRTVGLPGLDGVLGVTFGKVVTSRSPTSGSFNWGMTLWHEVAHIFALQLSRYRVPRWFTEGLSEYETARERPEWTRRTHAELHHALADGNLLSIGDLNAGFTHARDLAHIVVAYHEAAEAVSFLVRRWGFEVVPKALRLYGEGKATPTVIRAITGLDVAGFDAAFRADLASRLTAYENTFYVRSSDYADVEALEARVKAKPDDARATGLLALGLLAAHEGERAQKLVDETLKKPNAQQMREVVLAAAYLALARKDKKTAGMFFDGLVKNGGDGYDARYGLGQLAADENNVAEADTQLALAKKMDPDRAEPYVVLGKLFAKRGDEERAITELTEAARLEPMDGGAAKLLVEKLVARQRWAKVLDAGQRALFVDPYDATLHARIARALVELGRKAEARDELAAARDCEPDDKQRAEIDALAARAK
jgi:predicted Zn-dependent protease